MYSLKHYYDVVVYSKTLNLHCWSHWNSNVHLRCRFDSQWFVFLSFFFEKNSEWAEIYSGPESIFIAPLYKTFYWIKQDYKKCKWWFEWYFNLYWLKTRRCWHWQELIDVEWNKLIRWVMQFIVFAVRKIVWIFSSLTAFKIFIGLFVNFKEAPQIFCCP